MDDSVPTDSRFSPGSLGRDLGGVDDALLALLAWRLQLADAADGPLIRPGHDVQLMRRLIGAAQGLEPELVIEVWRALLAASLRRRRVVDVVIGGARGDPARLFDVARRHFGARTRITQVGEPQAALMRAAEQPETCLAVTAWPGAPNVGAWWPALSESRFARLRMIAGLPLLGEAEENPEACVFSASVATEAAGGDVSVLLVDDPHHRAQRALNEAGLAGREVARSEPRALMRVEGFVALDDLRVRAMTPMVERVRVLGSYARV